MSRGQSNQASGQSLLFGTRNAKAKAPRLEDVHPVTKASVGEKVWLLLDKHEHASWIDNAKQESDADQEFIRQIQHLETLRESGTVFVEAMIVSAKPSPFQSVSGLKSPVTEVVGIEVSGVGRDDLEYDLEFIVPGLVTEQIYASSDEQVLYR